MTEEESKIVNNQNLIRHFKKNDLLLSAGQYAKECYFVLNGCVRAYYLIDGEERNTSFFFENMSVRPVSYQKGFLQNIIWLVWKIVFWQLEVMRGTIF
ncbi:MAG TPA: cyclic nucleotide-binding domain-containing protein [Daejeonella sp.]|nr:cyclic nucleotide-binding domain-containing protein [Daejeonella sp.]